MTAVFPDATGLPLLFEGSPTVGLGLWSSEIAVNVGEYGTLLVGLAIYILTLIKLRKEMKTKQERPMPPANTARTRR